MFTLVDNAISQMDSLLNKPAEDFELEEDDEDESELAKRIKLSAMPTTSVQPGPSTIYDELHRYRNYEQNKYIKCKYRLLFKKWDFRFGLKK